MKHSPAAIDNRPSVRHVVAFALLFAAGSAFGATIDELVERMGASAERYNYRGTVARRFDGRVEYMRVVHRYAEGEVSERIETLDGADRTLIRDADGVRCVLPDSKAVLVQDSAGSHGFVGRVPASLERMRGHYDIVMVREGERVAGRKTVQLAIRPHDEYRYGHRIWLEVATGLPLKAELIDEMGRTVEETRFVDFEIADSIADAEFELDINVAGFRQIGQLASGSARPRLADAALDEPTVIDDLPPGFVLTHASYTDDDMAHWRIDDGMASVSVFIEPAGEDGKVMFGASKLGGTHTYSVQADGRQITAVGEIPLSTARIIAERIARSELTVAPE